MSPNLLQVEELFHLALAVKPEDRAGYLYSTCREDDLRQEVNSLISAYESESGVLDELVVTLAMRVLGSESDSTVEHEVEQTSITPESLAFDRGVRPMMEMVLPEKADVIISFRGDPELQARIEELARKSTEGELTDDERAEYAGYVRANKFVGVLKRQAQHIHKSQS